MTKHQKRMQQADQCLKCGLCTAYCPVARVTGAFPGPKRSGPDAERFRRPNQPSTESWTDLCLNCGICESVCPAGVNPSDLNLTAKAKLKEETGFSLSDKLLGRVYLLGKLGTAFAPLVNSILNSRGFGGFISRTFGLDSRRALPDYQRPTFRQWFQSNHGLGVRKIAYFYGCYTNTNEVDVGRAFVEVMERNGFEVILPKQQC